MTRELYDELESKFTSLPDFTAEKMKGISAVCANLVKWVLYVRDCSAYKFKDLAPYKREI